MSCESCCPKTDARLSAIEERVTALDRLMQSEMRSVALALDKADVKTNERFESHNMFRQQIGEERREYVTRKEAWWLVATLLSITALGLAVTKFAP